MCRRTHGFFLIGECEALVLTDKFTVKQPSVTLPRYFKCDILHISCVGYHYRLLCLSDTPVTMATRTCRRNTNVNYRLYLLICLLSVRPPVALQQVDIDIDRTNILATTPGCHDNEHLPISNHRLQSNSIRHRQSEPRLRLFHDASWCRSVKK